MCQEPITQRVMGACVCGSERWGGGVRDVWIEAGVMVCTGDV